MTPFDHLIGCYVQVHSLPTPWLGKLESVAMCGGQVYATLSDAALWAAGDPLDVAVPLSPEEWRASGGTHDKTGFTCPREGAVVLVTAIKAIPGPR